MGWAGDEVSAHHQKNNFPRFSRGKVYFQWEGFAVVAFHLDGVIRLIRVGGQLTVPEESDDGTQKVWTLGC